MLSPSLFISPRGFLHNGRKNHRNDARYAPAKQTRHYKHGRTLFLICLQDILLFLMVLYEKVLQTLFLLQSLKSHALKHNGFLPAHKSIGPDFFFSTLQAPRQDKRLFMWCWPRSFLVFMLSLVCDCKTKIKLIINANQQ